MESSIRSNQIHLSLEMETHVLSAKMVPLIDFFSSLREISVDEQRDITSYFQFRSYKVGEYLFKGGKVCKELFFISSGVVRIVAINEKGIDITHYFISDKQFCTMLQSFNTGTVAEDSIQACCNLEVLVITKSNLLKLYSKLPLISDLIDQANQTRLLEKIRLKNAYSGEDSINRYKIFLQQQPEIAYRVPLKDVASYLNVTPQSLSRIRKIVK